MKKTKPQRDTQQSQAAPEALASLAPHPAAAERRGIARVRRPKITLGTAGQELEPLA